MERKQKTKFSFFLLVGISTSFLLVTPIFVLLFTGLFLDKIFHTGPWLVLGGTIIGFIGGITNIYRLIKTMKA